MNGGKKKFVSNVIWETIGRLASLGIQFVVTILIARKVSPADFGVIGLLNVFILIGRIILDSGFSVALIQKKDATDVDLSSVFFLNLLISLILYVVSYTMSPFIAAFFNIPVLTKYARILFLIIPISSLGLIQYVIIQKKLEFKKSAIAVIISALISGIIGVWMAYLGYGIMALVYQMIFMQIITTMLYIILNRWKPIWAFSSETIKDMFSFGMNMLFTSILKVIFNNIYTLIIGKYYSASQVGYYNQAKKIEDVSSNTLTEVVLKVSYPTLVNYAANREQLKEAYRKIISMTVFILAPMMCLLLCIAKPLFILILTEKWLPAVPYFQILCIYGLTLPLHQVNANIFKIFKDGKSVFRIELFRRCILVVSILLTISLNIYGMLIGQAVSMLIVAIVCMYFSGKYISYKLSEQLSDIALYYGSSIVIAIMTYFFIPELNNYLYTLLFRTICFVVLYLVLNIIFKPSAYLECKRIMCSKKIKNHENRNTNLS